MTIICTIHQPRSNIVSLFDSLLILTHGHVAYHGPAHSLVSYLQEFGYVCPLYTNPTDYIFDLLHMADPESGQIIKSDSNRMIQGSESVTELGDEETDEVDDVERSKTLSSLYLQSENYKSAITYIDISLKSSSGQSSYQGPSSNGTKFDAYDHLPQSDPFHRTLFASFLSLLTSTAILFHRTWLLSIRSPAVIYTRGIAAIASAFLIGLIFFQQTSDVDNIVSASCFLICAFGLFGLPTISMYIENRVIYLRDTRSGFYGSVTYVFSNQIIELPILVGQVLVYSGISYWMVGFYAGWVEFFSFVLIVFLQTEVCFGVCQFLSLLSSTVNEAIAKYIFFYLFCLALGGFLIPPSSIPLPLHVLMYCDPFWYFFFFFFFFLFLFLFFFFLFFSFSFLFHYSSIIIISYLSYHFRFHFSHTFIIHHTHS
jgi:hypothetical protein